MPDETSSTDEIIRRLVEHQSGEVLASENRIGVLDLRPYDGAGRQFQQTIAGALCVDGVEGLELRYSWLPPRKTKVRKRPGEQQGDDAPALVKPARKLLVICASAEQRHSAERALEGWDVASFVLGTDGAFWQSAIQAGVSLEEQSANKPRCLFDPAYMAKLVYGVAMNNVFHSSSEISLLDLGCGAGRDMVWIADSANRSQNEKRWRISGIDNVPSVVQRANMFASEYFLKKGHNSTARSVIDLVICAQATRQGLLQMVDSSQTKGQQTCPANLADFAKQNLSQASFDVLLLVRFFPQELLYRLPELTHAGSLIAISHFTTFTGTNENAVGEKITMVELIKASYVHPTSDKRFERSHVDNLLTRWHANDRQSRWSVIHHSIDPCEDGRPLRNIIFRRLQ